jgi:phosphatidate cytidylyltransferase
MLRQRILTALVLIPLVVGGILYLSNPVFAICVGGAILVGAHEMARLANLTGRLAPWAFVGLIGAALFVAWQVLTPEWVRPMQWVMTAWWVAVTAMLLLRRHALGQVEGRRLPIMLLGGTVLVTAWMSIVALHAMSPYGPILVLFLFVLIWVADSGAYFAGRAFGRRKLSPFVSPGKTWAGAGGAAVGAAVSAAALSVSGLVGDPSLPAVVLLCVVVTAISIGGDLWESRLKREAGVKDSGNLLPGHGGMLDRIDSLLAAAPVFGLGIGLIGVAG